MRKLSLRAFCSATLILAWHLPLYGAGLAGIVMEDGEPVAAAEVKLVNADNRVILKNVSTDAEGAFRFIVKPGVFDVLVFKSQYANAWSRGIVVGNTDVFRKIQLVPKAFVEDEDPGDSGDCDP